MAENWMCGAFSPPWPDYSYRCTRKAGHRGRHRAELAGVKLASWHHSQRAGYRSVERGSAEDG